MSPRLLFRDLAIITAAVLCLSSVDLLVEWPVRGPGDPQSSVHTVRHACGFAGGGIVYMVDDVLDYSNLAAGLDFRLHLPRMPAPIISGGWWDFGVVGVAVWLVGSMSFCWSLIRRRGERSAISERSRAPAREKSPERL